MGLTRAKAARNPTAVILSYTDHDIRRGRLLPDTHIAAIADMVMRGEWTQLRHDSPVTGPAEECYGTVIAAQRAIGGKIHTGWMTCPQQSRTGENKLGGIALIAHAVLERNGELFETIPAYRNSRFLIDDAIPFGSQMGVDFLDRVQDAQYLSYGIAEVNVLTRTIDLALTRRELTAPDPDREARVIEAWQAWQETIAA